MIIFKDRVTGDELFTDASCPKLNEDGTMYTFPTKYITVKEGEDIKLAGANPSAEEAQEETEAVTKTDFDFVLSNRLQNIPLGSKKDLQLFIKGFFKNMKTCMQEAGDEEEKVKCFENSAKGFVKDMLENWKDYSFFQGESMDEKGMCIIVKWNDDGTSGTAYAFRDGLKEEKY